jgi:YVTN family beta-propeller protein
MSPVGNDRVDRSFSSHAPTRPPSELTDRSIVRPSHGVAPAWRGKRALAIAIVVLTVAGGLGLGLEPGSHPGSAPFPWFSPVAPDGAPIPGSAPALLLDPSSGVVGTTIAASGVGFGPDASIALTFDGSAVTSTCSTDSSGAFPGSSGTPCTFPVPGLSLGSYLVNASDGTRSAVANFSITSLTLLPASGPVGSSIAVRGSGFEPNATVSFELGGAVAASDCMTGLNGTFPGASGTPCTLRAPSNPAGVLPLTAVSRAWNSTPLLSLGPSGYPNFFAYDPMTGQEFVTNSGPCFGSLCNGTVAALNGSGPTAGNESANVTVGPDPWGIAFDPVSNQLFVANANACLGGLCNGTVSVVNVSGPSTFSVLTNITVGPTPQGVAFDPATDQIFVVNNGACVGSGCNGTVSVIDPTNDSVVDTIGVGASPYDLAYDAGTDQVFVTDSNDCFGYNCDGGVSVINASGPLADTIVATVVVGAEPRGLAYDPTSDRVFVSNFDDCLGSACNGTVSVIDDSGPSADSAIATFPVGPSPWGEAYDPDTGEVFVADHWACAGPACEGNLSVINGSDLFLVGTAVTGSGPAGVGVDPVSGVIFAADHFDDTVAVEAPLPLDSGSGRFTILPSIQLSSAYGVVGQEIEVEGTGFAANASVSLTFAGTALPATCTGDTVGSFPPSAQTPCGFTVPDDTVGTPYTVEATDGTNQANETFMIDTMSLSPASATVGTIVSASGQYFPPDSAIEFRVDGTPAPSSCLTNGAGEFPGGPSTSCTFEVPPTPGGPEVVQAISSPVNYTSVTLASGIQNPVGLTYDSSDGDLFVPNQLSANVTLVAANTGAILGNVTDLPAGGHAFHAVYDPGTNQVFVTNLYSNAVTVINSSNLVVANWVRVGLVPTQIVYDPNQGAVLVGYFVPAGISEINDTNDTVVGTIADSGQLAFDPVTGELFVTNSNLGTVSVFNTSSDALVTNVTVGSQPGGIAYDSETDQIYVSDQGSRNLSVINASGPQANTVVATIPLNFPCGQLEFDPGSGQIIVASTQAGPFGSRPGVLALAIQPSNQSIVATIDGSGSIYYLTYDDGNGAVYYSNGSGDTVNELVADGAQLLGSATLGVLAHVALATPTGEADVGQNVTVTATGFGSGDPITDLAVGSTSTVCTLALVGTCVGGAFATNAVGSLTGNFTVPIIPGGTYAVTLTDSAGNSAAENWTIFADPTVGAVEPNVTNADVGENVSFSATAGAGSGGYTYDWGGLPGPCVVGSDGVAQCDPSVSGNYTLVVTVTDSDGVAVTSQPLEFPVHSAPQLERPVGSPGSGNVDAGQTVHFTVGAFNGSGTYPTFRWSGLPSGCIGSTDSVTCTGAALARGTYSIWVTVTDSNGVTSAPSPTLTFIVEPDPVVFTPTANVASADAGQTVIFSESSDAGSPIGYSIEWGGLPVGCMSDPTLQVTCPVTTSGTSEVTFGITDANNLTMTSQPFAFSVYSDPSVELTVAHPGTDVGINATFTATAENGSGGFGYTWTGLPTGTCTGSGAVVVCDPDVTGTSQTRVTIVDSNGETAVSNTESLIIAADVGVKIASSSTTVSVGQSVTFNATGTGGTGALTYEWDFGGGAADNGASVAHVFESPGNTTVALWANDTVGSSVEKTVVITVTGGHTTSGPSASGSGLPEPATAIAIGIAVVVILALLAILLTRRGPPAAGASPSGATSSVSESPPNATQDSETADEEGEI